MENLKRNWRHLVLCALTVATILLLFGNTALWQTAIGPMHNAELTGYPFSDMGARLWMSEKAAGGHDINQEFGNNKPLYTVTLMKWLGLNSSNKVALGILFLGLYTLWNLLLLRPRRTVELLISIGVLLSPPCLMLIERGNDDIIIYSLICGAPLLLQLNSGLGRFGAWAVISILLPMKYYPAAAYAILLHREHSFKRLTGFVLLSFAFLIAFSLFAWQEMSEIHDRIPVASVFCSFGGGLLFDAVWIDPAIGQIFLIFGFGGLLCAAFFVLFRAEPIAVERHSTKGCYFLLGSSVLTFCFFMNGNWDYRLAFLIPTLPLIFRWLNTDNKKARVLATIYVSSMLFTLWPEYVYYTSVHEGYSTWVHKDNLHVASIVLKHAASWVMIGSQMLIAAYLLQPDLRYLIEDSPFSPKRKARANT
ncbi:hypothetical protein DDZ13_01410 [Coraliomargarita sinensis]|uniref:DUF2029 domain-containing protein n=1 Tax=Coraliomargarita sinensis TaxID=2174842 RepID=A0A317ZNU6_9BACT|nr:hypothetical protein [Coraliomargarita sinensis]PXA05558.1 hypothetical protein DDZ13_01410 [Coraliomargarita sinensis]